MISTNSDIALKSDVHCPNASVESEKLTQPQKSPSCRSTKVDTAINLLSSHGAQNSSLESSSFSFFGDLFLISDSRSGDLLAQSLRSTHSADALTDAPCSAVDSFGWVGNSLELLSPISSTEKKNSSLTNAMSSPADAINNADQYWDFHSILSPRMPHIEREDLHTSPATDCQLNSSKCAANDSIHVEVMTVVSREDGTKRQASDSCSDPCHARQSIDPTKAVPTIARECLERGKPLCPNLKDKSKTSLADAVIQTSVAQFEEAGQLNTEDPVALYSNKGISRSPQNNSRVDTSSVDFETESWESITSDVASPKHAKVSCALSPKFESVLESDPSPSDERFMVAEFNNLASAHSSKSIRSNSEKISDVVADFNESERGFETGTKGMVLSSPALESESLPHMSASNATPHEIASHPERRRSLVLIEKLRSVSIRRESRSNENGNLVRTIVDAAQPILEFNEFRAFASVSCDKSRSAISEAESLCSSAPASLRSTTWMNVDESPAEEMENDSLACSSKSQSLNSDGAEASHSPSAEIDPPSAFSEEDVDTPQRIVWTGGSSSTFIHQLRGAAFRRKMNLARSRDSLIAKEQQQRTVIASFEAERKRQEKERLAAIWFEHQSRAKIVTDIAKVVFKARALPKTTGSAGNGGLSGVPKIAKKQTTTPLSPFMGARRHQSGKHVARMDCSNHAKHSSSSFLFRALPVPKSTNQCGGAGQAGVPKVIKREVTVPESPLLGQRRKPNRSPLKDRRISPTKDNVCLRRNYNFPSSESTCLVGLNVDSRTSEYDAVYESSAQKMRVVQDAFVPHSTRRALERARFEQRRLQQEKVQKVEAQKERQARLKALENELNQLRLEI